MMPPYSFDQPAYRRCFASPLEAMDERHIWMLHGVLTAWPFREALELGSWWGASSTAFVEAINAGHQMRATFCDTDPTAGLAEVLGNCRHPERVRFTRQPSWEVLESAEAFDLILVDANHDLGNVGRELLRLLPRRPFCLLAHDTNAMAAGYDRSEGSALLRQIFQALPGYHCLEDAADRPGEETRRGLFLATTSRELYDEARGVWAYYGAGVTPAPLDEMALENWPTAMETRVLVRS